MIINNFTKPELDFFRENCNFTKAEKEVFEYRANDYTLEECAALMHMSLSTIKRISRKINNKIIRVC